MKVSACIPKARLPHVEAQLTKLNERLSRLGYGPCVLTLGPESQQAVQHGAFAGHIDMVEVTVAGPEVTVADSELQVSIDHRTQPPSFKFYTDEASLPARYLEAKSHCEHCGYTRQRNTTYVLYQPQTHRHIQVGHTCLEDFLKVSPEQALRAAGVLDALRELVTTESAPPAATSSGRGLPVVVQLADYLPYVAAAIRRHGWVSAKEGAEGYALATWQQASQLRTMEAEGMPQLEPADQAVATEAVAKLQTDIPRDTYFDDYWGNLAEIAHRGACEVQRFPVAALIVREYLRERLAAEKKLRDSASRHFGAKGERLDLQVEVVDVKPVFSTYGTKWYHRFRTPGGDIAIWFGSKTMPVFIKGAVAAVRATVKEHEVYHGIQQTQLARVSVR